MAALDLPDFETVTDSASRQQSMLQRLNKHGANPKLLAQLSRCNGGECDSPALCFEACHFAVRQQRLSLIPQADKLLLAHDGPLCSVSIAHPAWEVAHTQLRDTPMAAAKQWLSRRLMSLNVPGLRKHSVRAAEAAGWRRALCIRQRARGGLAPSSKAGAGRGRGPCDR